jgi:hypothetical protein
MRLHAQTAMIENALVHIPEAAPWLAEYLHEISVFPKGKHDHQVDSTAEFLDWFKTPMSCQGIFELHRREAEKLKSPEPVYVRVKAPNLLGPAYPHRGGSHRRDSGRGRQLLDFRQLDLAQRNASRCVKLKRRYGRHFKWDLCVFPGPYVSRRRSGITRVVETGSALERAAD